MATAFKRSGVWVAKWRDASGAWRQERTNFHHKAATQSYAEELEQKGRRQARGLEPLERAGENLTFVELYEWWWTEYGARLKTPAARGFTEKHLVPALGSLTLPLVTTAELEGLLNGKALELSPRSLNHLRGFLHRIFSLAIKREKWLGPNPAAKVERRKVPQGLPEYLRFEEVPLLIDALDPKWRPLFVTALFTGMRQGELLGLRKQDVDIVEGTITVGRSYEQTTTKGGHTDVIPIAEPLVPFLVDAIAASLSELVFPRADGAMRNSDTALDKVLRRALGRAGIVTGYLHKCRRHGCGFEQPAQSPTCGRCPRCKMVLWAKPIPRHVRFHDVRHSTATLLLKRGVSAAVVQRVLRHKDARLTLGTYGHLDIGDMRAGVNTLKLLPATAVAEDAPDLAPTVELAAAGPLPATLQLGELLTVSQVAKKLGVCRATVYRLCEERRLPHIRVSNAIRVGLADLDAFINQGRA